MLNEQKSTGPGKKVEINFTSQVKLDPLTPLPVQYGGDSFAIIKGRKYIPFLGKDNNLPNLLLEARKTSPTQDQCISSIASSVVGNGLSVLDIDPEKVEPDLMTWFKAVNNQQDSFDEILYGVIDGEREQGNQFIEVVVGAVNKAPFMKVYLHPFQYCRFAELEKDEREPSKVIISKLFAKRGFRKLDNAVAIPLWSPNPLDQDKCWLKDEKGNKRTILHLKNKVQGVDYYGLPASISGLQYQVQESLMARYNIDNFENNMIPGGMLIFKASMTQEEAEEQARQILFSYSGTGTTGRVAVVASENGIADVEFIQYNTQKEGSFIELGKSVAKTIIACNNWHEILIGLNEGGGSLGNGNNYIRSVWHTKEASLLNPLRVKITDKVVVPLMKIWADVYKKPKVLEYKFWFNSSVPFNFLADIKPEQYIKVREARAESGLEVDPSVGEKYLAEMNMRTTNSVSDPSLDPENKNNV